MNLMQSWAGDPLNDLKLLLEWYGEYFPCEDKPMKFEVNEFKHIAIWIFYESFCKPSFETLLEWDNED